MANNPARIRRPDGSWKSGHRPTRRRPGRRTDRGHECMQHGQRSWPPNHPALLENRNQHLGQRPPRRRHPALPLLRIPPRRTDRLQTPPGTRARRPATHRRQTGHTPKTGPRHQGEHGRPKTIQPGLTLKASHPKH